MARIAEGEACATRGVSESFSSVLPDVTIDPNENRPPGLGGRLHVFGGLCHSPYAGITQIRFSGVDSVLAALSAWLIPSSPRAVFVLCASLSGWRVDVKLGTLGEAVSRFRHRMTNV